MSIASEFKNFAAGGNVVDLAVGVIIGAAFGKIVSSFVEDVLMPPIGLLLGGIDFSNLAITLRAAVGDQPPVQIHYGLFINTVINFLIVAACIFAVVKGLNTLKHKEEATVAAPTGEEVLLTEIRDLLREKPLAL